MPIKILMPALSPTMTEGNLAKWLKKEGERVLPGDVIAEIETDKATMEVEAIDEGIVGKILVPAGTENVAVNSLIALLLEEGEDVNVLIDFKTEASPTISPSPSVTETKMETPTEMLDLPSTNQPKKQPTDFKHNDRIFASPLAKRIAEVEGVNLRNVSGTGPHGRIIKADVMSAKKNVGSVDRSHIEYRVIPNNNVRKIIAKRLLESKQTIPHFYLTIECNLDRLIEVRQDINKLAGDDKLKKVSVNDFVILATSKALKEVPEANASWDDSAIRYYNNVDISVAVAIEGGLITPIIKNADQKNIVELSMEMKDLAKRARENKLLPEEFQGGGFSISNLGMFGIKKFSAIINPPQSCILAVGESSKRAVVIDDQIKIATMVDLTLSSDHRVVDGVVGAKFLAAFKKFIESPVLMFL